MVIELCNKGLRAHEGKTDTADRIKSIKLKYYGIIIFYTLKIPRSEYLF
jgi:hypothetical protein